MHLETHAFPDPDAAMRWEVHVFPNAAHIPQPLMAEGPKKEVRFAVDVVVCARQASLTEHQSK
jgi:hypothetical protein